MSTKTPKTGDRIMGLRNEGGRGTTLSFATVTGHTRAEGSREVVGIEVEYDGGGTGDYRLSTYGDFWEMVADHRVSTLDIDPVQPNRWKSRFGNYPARASVAAAVADAREWWTAKVQPPA